MNVIDRVGQMTALHGLTSRLRLYALTLIAAFLLPLILTGSAQGAIPDSSGTITGCYNKDGILRVIDTASGGTCLPGETLLTSRTK
jgi:hypothetical protein